jgi:hypothetical protein
MREDKPALVLTKIWISSLAMKVALQKLHPTLWGLKRKQ